MGDQKPSVDELRARLRELGYLDTGVDRFVLGPVRVSRGLFDVAWRSSVRIGLLAGLLLGPSTAAALGARLPGLVTGPRDLVVLACYLGVLFGAGVAVASLVVMALLGVVTARGGRGAPAQARAPWLARAAGTVVAASCLAYLVLWWRAMTPAGAVWRSVAWTLPALVLATGVSMLLGHAVMVATLALAAREARGPSAAFRRPSRAWRPTLGLGLFAFAAGAGLLFLATVNEDRARPATPPAIVVEPTGVHLTLVAIDGFDLAFLERLEGAGRVPRLARLLAGGRLLLPASDAPDPARTWTSLATGQPAAVHGVSGIETRQVSGIAGSVPAGRSALASAIAAATDLVRLTRPALTTGLQRRSKTFWEVAAEHGLRTFVVNWWATWPAPDGPGVVLTDRATLRLERGGELDAEIAPAALYPPLRQAWPTLRDQAWRAVLQAFPETGDAVADLLRQAAEQDAIPVALVSRVSASAADLRAVYLPGLDIAQHGLMGAGAGSVPASVMVARVDALERYYVFLDRLLAPLADPAGPGDTVALLADPGRAASPGPGILAVSGSQVAKGVTLRARGADVAPTLLYLLGLPASRELPGRPRTDLMSGDFTARVRIRTVDSYGPRLPAPRPPSAAPLDREMLDRLRSLGYVR
jgi:hypothetical protein